MISPLAYAQGPDVTDSSLVLVVYSAGLILAVCGAGFAPIRMAWMRHHRQAEVIITLVLFWALLTAGSLIYATATQLNWSREYQMRIMSGYADPRDQSGAPKLPWLLWGILAVVYAGLVFWAASQRNPMKQRGFPVTPTHSEKQPPTGPAA